MPYSVPSKGVVLRLGEVFLKGKNRGRFIDNLERNIGRVLSKELGDNFWIERGQGRLYVKVKEELIGKVVFLCSKIFGIVSLSPVIFVSKEVEEIKRAIDLIIEAEKLESKNSFKIEARRSDKRFPLDSMELNRILGEYIVQKYGWKVELFNPEVIIYVEIGFREASVYTKIVKGAGGLPVGVSGKGLLLLSGGIDSPVAGYLIQKRGCLLEAVYFHSPPYTGEGAKDKVVSIVKKLLFNQESMNLYVVPFTKIQEAFKLNCDNSYLVILYRRAMVRVANMIAKAVGAKVLITGESLGQVASQTMDNINCIAEASELQILRPLIGLDKSEIIAIAKEIGTYDISIQPFQDCCSLFVPKHPKTNAILEKVKREESKLHQLASLLEEAYNNKERVVVYG